MNKQVRGNRFFILLLLVLLVSLYFSRILSNQTSYEYNTYTLIKDIEKGSYFEISKSTLKGLINKVLFAVATDDSRPILKGIKFEIIKKKGCRIIPSQTNADI